MATQRLSELESPKSNSAQFSNPSTVLTSITSLWSENLTDNGKVSSSEERQKSIDQHRTNALNAIRASETGIYFSLFFLFSLQTTKPKAISDFPQILQNGPTC
jgi:hypothetical protein